MTRSWRKKAIPITCSAPAPALPFTAPGIWRTGSSPDAPLPRNLPGPNRCHPALMATCGHRTSCSITANFICTIPYPPSAKIPRLWVWPWPKPSIHPHRITAGKTRGLCCSQCPIAICGMRLTRLWLSITKARPGWVLVRFGVDWSW